MDKWIGSALLLIMASLFLIANRDALGGFFSADELDNLGWTPQVPAAVFAKDLVSPIYNGRNFRPVGHLYFRIMSLTCGLDFPKYVLPLQLLHLFNVWLLWQVLRRLGASAFAASAGALYFAFHMAVFDVYWKPMYAFDLFCSTFCLLSLLFWISRRWVLSFLAFWLAYKSKELAVMLPAVLACYEYWFGKREWKPLVPFFAVSLSFGLQGIRIHANQNNDYALRFTPGAVEAAIRFYTRAFFGVPFLAIALLALAAVWRDRRMWLGAAATVLFLAPLIVLPGRLFSAYWYEPLVGAAMAFASLANSRYGFLAAVFLAGWLPWNYVELDDYGSQKLADDGEAREYVTQLQAAAPSFDGIPTFLYHGLPQTLTPWGVGGALRYLLPDRNVKVFALEDPTAKTLLESTNVATLTWVARSRKLWIAARTPQTQDSTYIIMNEVTPVWQLLDGWYGLEDGFRWTAPRANARLYRARRANQFEVVLIGGGSGDLTVRLNGAQLGSVHLAEPGIRTIRWALPPGPPGTVAVEFQVAPAQHPRADPRTLGAAIMSFGFLPSGH